MVNYMPNYNSIQAVHLRLICKASNPIVKTGGSQYAYMILGWICNRCGLTDNAGAGVFM